MDAPIPSHMIYQNRIILSSAIASVRPGGSVKRDSGKTVTDLNPAIAFFKGLVKVMLYIKVFSIANI